MGLPVRGGGRVRQRCWCEGWLTLGSPVVPLVYMMVQRSSGFGGAAGAGDFLPKSRNSCQVYALMPASLAACTISRLSTLGTG